jgi:ribonuclease HI
MSPIHRRPATSHLFPVSNSSRGIAAPEFHLIAHIDGGARGNPGPAGYGVVITDQAGHKLAGLSEYLGHQTNNVAEYSGLLAALDYATRNGNKALKVVSDSELMVKQIRGEYKVKNPTLQELHARAKALIRKLDWFTMQHTLREGNQEADRLANEAMDKGMGRRAPSTAVPAHVSSDELEGVVRNGVIELVGGKFPDGAKVRVRLKQ